MTILAMSNEWTIGLMLAQWAFNILFGVGFWWLQRRVRRGDENEQQRRRHIESIERELKQAATNQIEDKMTVLETRMMGKIDTLAGDVAHIRRRLDRGDNEFDTLKERDHQADTKVLLAISGLKDWMNERFATRGDVNRIEGRIESLPCGTCAPAGGDP